MLTINVNHGLLSDNLMLKESNDKLWCIIQTLTERTKRHTKDIQELRREVKKDG